MAKLSILAYIAECCYGCDYQPKRGTAYCQMHKKQITQKLLSSCENAI